MLGMLPLSKKVALTAGLMMLGGALPGHASDMNKPATAQTAQARELCTEIIGVGTGDARFKGCVASLAGSLQSARQEHVVIQARGECFARGLQPGSPELSLCLLNASAVNPESSTANPLIGGSGDPSSAPKAILELGDLTDREQQACARTGFDPAFGAFANCVANLQGVLQITEIPAN